jgi:hypothetical protein
VKNISLNISTYFINNLKKEKTGNPTKFLRTDKVPGMLHYQSKKKTIRKC